MILLNRDANAYVFAVLICVSCLQKGVKKKKKNKKHLLGKENKMIKVPRDYRGH